MKIRNIFGLIAAFALAAFVACENSDGGTDTGSFHEETPIVHNHTWSEWEDWEPEYEDGGSGRIISCTDSECGAIKDSELTGGGGVWLTFTKINDDTEYRVSKVSADLPFGIVIIPARYRDTDEDDFLPVTDISNGASNTTANNAFGGNNAANAAKVFAVAIPATVKTIAAYAFYNCPLQDISFAPDSSLESIGATAFRNCSSLTVIAIPEGVTSMGNGAFQNCTGLTDVIIPESLTTIPSSLFNGCTALTEVVFPSSVTVIGSSVFQNCTGLISVTIPESITTIPYGLFDSCTNLVGVTIPDGVTSIAGSVFRNTGITGITIPANVTSIDDQAFYGCTKLEVITCLAETPPTLEGQNVFFNVYDYMVIKVPAASVAAYKAAPLWKLEADFISAIE